MNDIDVVDKIFEEKFGKEFRDFATSNGEPLTGVRNARKNNKSNRKRRTKVRKRSQFESPYQLYPQPVPRRKRRSTNFSNIKEKASLPKVSSTSVSAVNSVYSNSIAGDEEEKVPEDLLTINIKSSNNEDGRQSLLESNVIAALVAPTEDMSKYPEEMLENALQSIALDCVALCCIALHITSSP